MLLFWRKSLLLLHKYSNWSVFLDMHSHIPLLQLYRVFLKNCFCLWTITPFTPQKSIFSQFFTIFVSKILFCGVKGVIINEQKQFFKKTLYIIVVEVYGNVSTKKQINWSIYERGVAISVEKVALEFQCEKSVFRPKIGQFSIFFKNLLAIDKTT